MLRFFLVGSLSFSCERQRLGQCVCEFGIETKSTDQAFLPSQDAAPFCSRETEVVCLSRTGFFATSGGSRKKTKESPLVLPHQQP
jgi:hypothetical protein